MGCQTRLFGPILFRGSNQKPLVTSSHFGGVEIGGSPPTDFKLFLVVSCFNETEKYKVHNTISLAKYDGLSVVQ